MSRGGVWDLEGKIGREVVLRFRGCEGGFFFRFGFYFYRKFYARRVGL